MATTKLWPVRDSVKRVLDYTKNPEKTEYSELSKVLHYAENDTKTFSGDEKVFFVTGVHCSREHAFEEMLTVQEQFGKVDRNLCYHGYQSFKPGEVTPQQCHDIGIMLAEQLWGSRHQVLVATHLNTGHLHNHFVIYSVSYRDGKKFEAKYWCYRQMRKASDALCRSMGLSVIEKPKGKTPRNLYFAEKRGEPTKYNLMREAIDNAIKICSTRKDFETALREQGYFINDDSNRKYATIRRIADAKPVRLYQLGEEYDLPKINERLDRNYYRFGSRYYDKHFNPIHQPKKQPSQPKNYLYRGSLEKCKKISGFKALYLYYSYLMGILPKHKPHQPLSPQMREEVRKMNQFSRQARLIGRKNLNNTEDVQCLIDNNNGILSALQSQRDKCYNRLRRCDDSQEIAKIKAERDALTEQITDLRKENKTAVAVLESSLKMHENTKIERAFIAAKREQEQLAKIQHKNLKIMRGKNIWLNLI